MALREAIERGRVTREEVGYNGHWIFAKLAVVRSALVDCWTLQMSAVHVNRKKGSLTIYVSALPLDVAAAALIAGLIEANGDALP